MIRNYGIVLATVILGALIGLPAYAATCEGIATQCVQLGASRSDCFNPQRIANCRRTGQYHAPSGRVWTASERGGKGLTMGQCMAHGRKLGHSEEATRNYCNIRLGR